MIQAVESQRDHFHWTRAGRGGRNGPVFSVQVTDLPIASPRAKTFISPRVGDIQKLAIKRMLRAVIEIFLRHPEQGCSRSVAGQCQWFEIQAAQFRALPQQFPIVATRFLNPGGLPVIKLREILFSDQASEYAVGKAQSRIQLAEFLVGQQWISHLLSFQPIQNSQSLEKLQLAI